MSTRFSMVVVLALTSVLPGCEDSPAEAEENEVRAERVQLEAAPADPDRISELPQVDLEDLEAPARRKWVRLVNDLLSPCGDPVSVARCVAEERSCNRCVPAARYVARLAGEGWEDSEIAELYRARYDDELEVEIPVGDSPTRGAAMPSVTIVEFSDFECPHCAAAHEPLERIVHELEGEVQLVYKHFPLELHEHAVDAAKAAVAAHRQGRFWEMHDLLFDNQLQLTPMDLERYATQIGLDMDQFRSDMASEEVRARVMEDKELGTRLGVQGTPSLFVDGRPYLGPIESLPIYLREEIDR